MMTLVSLLSALQRVLVSVPLDQPWKGRFTRDQIGIWVA
jgi:hypothetical protein